MRLIQLAVATVLCLAPVIPVHAIIYYNDSTDNTTAPTGDYAGSGWQWQGNWGPGSGTVISAKQFITVKHYGWAFSSSSTFTLNSVTYHYSSHVDDPNSDLRIVTIQETFSSWAPLYADSSENDKEAVIFGRGDTRGDEVMVGGTLKGWEWFDTDGTRRWGTNDVSGFASGGKLLSAKFDASGGADEAAAADWDSAGGWFIKDGDTWKLAGVTYYTSGPFDLDSDHTSGVFSASLFDRGGLYDKTSGSWVYTNDLPTDNPSLLYATRISSQMMWINDNFNNFIPKPGDANLDGIVSGADYTIYAANYGQAGGWEDGDFNGDGVVTGADYNIYAKNYGTQPLAGAPVPEPVCLVLLSLGAIGMIIRRRR